MKQELILPAVAEIGDWISEQLGRPNGSKGWKRYISKELLESLFRL